MGKLITSALKVFVIMVIIKWEILAQKEDFIVKICEKLFKDNNQVVIINFDSKPKVVDDKIIDKCRHFPLKVIKLSKGDKEILLNESCIATFESVESLSRFNIIYSTKKQVVDFQVFVKFERGTVKEVEKSYAKLVNQIEFTLPETSVLYFLIDEASMTTLHTFVWYTSAICNKIQLLEVNRYLKFPKQWQSAVMKIDKFTNYYGCNVAFMFPRSDSAESVIGKNESENVIEQVNFDHLKRFVGIIATKLNFTAVYLSLNDDSNNSIAVMTRCYDEDSMIVITFPFLSMSFYSATPLGKEYDCYEKLFLPFDQYVWSLIAMTFCVSFLVIWLLMLTSLSTRNFVIGTRVTSPQENLARILFGISQTFLPGRNFSRFLTILFVLFCLIIRTAWQGKVFEFMQKDMRKPRVESYEEMIEKNFTLFSKPLFLIDFRQLPPQDSDKYES